MNGSPGYDWFAPRHCGAPTSSQRCPTRDGLAKGAGDCVPPAPDEGEPWWLEHDRAEDRFADAYAATLAGRDEDDAQIWDSADLLEVC